jgi:dTDP-4-dehydrorhamnose 3,5-epimerase-like enzyme
MGHAETWSSTGCIVTTPDRYEDARGILTVVAPEGKFNFMEVVTFASPDVVRGNHYHSGYQERAFLQSGELELRVRADAEDEPKVIYMRTGQMVDIPPGVIHTFIAKAASVLVCFGSGTSPMSDRNSVPAK